MDRKKLYFTAVGIGAGLLVRSVLRRRVSDDLYGKVVLITGGAHGLGRLLAGQFAAEGAKLALCDHDPAELDLTRQELEARGTHVFALRCDVTNLAQVDGMIEAVLDRYGVVDVLVNNAGAAPTGAAQEMTLADVEQAMDAMFWGVVYPTRAVLPHMLERRAGRIVNIVTNGGKLAAAHHVPQDCAKFAAIGFSEGLRSELLKENITVVTIAPGGISLNESRAARQIVTATERGEANGMSPASNAGVLGLIGDLLPSSPDSKSHPRTPAMSALAMLGRMAARRYLRP
jgi:NAD(P)-dependent dehydrogenase (short-subunit alcohol dehydrogenase family)